MERVNLFNPFNRPESGAEDRLTWAFLVTLKYDPMLQEFVRKLVEDGLPRDFLSPFAHWRDGGIWEPAHVSTQTGRIQSCPHFLVSVLLTDERIREEITVDWSDRAARYDGVIEYPDGLTLILENKPSHENVWEEQLCPSMDSFPDGIDGIKLFGSAICLEWSEVLEGVLRYTDSTMPSFTNLEIARDFLSFVEEYHPMLTPYRTFALCGDNREALNRRIARLVAKMAGMLPDVEDGGDHLYRSIKIAQRIFFEVHDAEGQPWKLRVSMWPASTAAQAHAFRSTVQRSAFLSLNEQGWGVRPNLNFAFPMGRKILWVSSPCGTQEYLDYFFSGENRFAQKREHELPDYIDEWEANNIIDPEGRGKIDGLRAGKPYLNVNPEFMVYRDWDRDTVIELEGQGELEAHIIRALAIPLKTWGETLP